MSVTEINPGSVIEELAERKPLSERIGSLIRKQPLGLAGLLVVCIMVICAIFAEYISPYDPELASFEHMLIPPSGDFLLGTDQFGRDMLTRLIFGAQTALFIGFTCAFVGSFVGLILGVGSAYFGGKVDLIFQRVMDVFMAFPLIILALAIVSIFGTSMSSVITAITIPFIPRCARVVRSSALAIREIPYIDAARACGFSHFRIILRHMAPNVMAPFLIILTAAVGQAILTEASLSYLGMGVQEPTPAWGLMLQGGTEESITGVYWTAVFPGVAITLAVFGFFVLGDALRDVLDPKLRRA